MIHLVQAPVLPAALHLKILTLQKKKTNPFRLRERGVCRIVMTRRCLNPAPFRLLPRGSRLRNWKVSVQLHLGTFTFFIIYIHFNAINQ